MLAWALPRKFFDFSNVKMVFWCIFDTVSRKISLKSGHQMIVIRGLLEGTCIRRSV